MIKNKLLLKKSKVRSKKITNILYRASRIKIRNIKKNFK